MKRFFGFLVFVLNFFFIQPVFAGNDITITCNGGASECTVSPDLPIFNETNIYPGYTTSQKFYVDNNRDSACNLTLKATSNSVTDLLSSKIFISIRGTNNSNNLNISNYLLSDLLDPSKPNLSLGHVNKNKKNNYEWTVTLDQSADNTYQNLTSNFNVDFNFQCDDDDITPTPTSTGDVLGTSVSVTSSPQCTNSVPTAPTGFYVVNNNGSATLHWTHTTSDHTGYLIAFGTSPGNYQYGAPDIGNDDFYTVRSLTPGAQYCFYVRSLNGCMPGDRTPEYCINPGSNIVAANIAPSGFQTGVLGASTENENLLAVTPTPQESSSGQILGESQNVCQKYWLPLFFLLAFFLNIIFISRLSPKWFVLLFISALAFSIDYLINKNTCCYGQKWLCNYYWIGDILSFIIPSFLSQKLSRRSN